LHNPLDADISSVLFLEDSGNEPGDTADDRQEITSEDFEMLTRNQISPF
jgi:hypothetical protein